MAVSNCIACDHLCNQKMFDVLWMMDDVIPPRRKMADG